MKDFFSRLFAGAGIGFLLGGPLGAILGAAFTGGLSNTGHLFGKPEVEKERILFTTNLVVLLTLVAKADDHISSVEARTIAGFFKTQMMFGEAELAAVRKIMKETLRANPPAEQVAADFAMISSYQERLAFLRLLWMVAAADSHIDRREKQVINRIAVAFRIEAADQRIISAEFIGGGKDYYSTLGLTPDATDREIKAAYRRMAREYHPDKVAHLGEEYERMATEKFATINAAYKAIRRERGF